MDVTGEHSVSTVATNATVYRNRQKSSLIMIELQRQRENGTFCDVLLEAGGLQYWAHSCVLAAHSKKLGSAVENGKAKFGAKGVIKMKLPTSNSLLVESLIKYMYDAHLSITSENVEDMIQLAAKLEMDDVKQCCAVHLCRTMTANNWAYVKRTGETYKLEDAIKGIQEYCSKNFCDVVHDFDFLDLDLNHLEVILKAGNENSIPRVELHLLYGILKWVSHNMESRKQHYEQLVNILSPKLLSTDKCLALFEEETIKNSNLMDDEVTKDLLQRITETMEADKRSLEEGVVDDGDDDYEPERKRKSKHRPMQESEYPRTDDGRFVCPHCLKTFEKCNSLLAHFKAHNAHWLCDTCGYTTETYYHRLAHMLQEHKEIAKEAKFVCGHHGCDYKCAEYEDMLKHCEEHKLSNKPKEQAKPSQGKAVGDAMKSSDIYSKKPPNVRTVKECPFCKGFCTFKNDRLINHIKKSHADVTVEQMQEELKKILNKSNDD